MLPSNRPIIGDPSASDRATLCAACDGRSAIQASLLGAELGLKAALANSAASDEDLKRYRHDLPRLAKAVNDAYTEFQATSATARIRMLPKLVDNRYSAQQPSRMETGNIAIACQHNSGAVPRVFTGGSFGRDFEATEGD